MHPQAKLRMDHKMLAEWRQTLEISKEKLSKQLASFRAQYPKNLTAWDLRVEINWGSWVVEAELRKGRDFRPVVFLSGKGLENRLGKDFDSIDLVDIPKPVFGSKRVDEAFEQFRKDVLIPIFETAVVQLAAFEKTAKDEERQYFEEIEEERIKKSIRDKKREVSAAIDLLQSWASEQNLTPQELDCVSKASSLLKAKNEGWAQLGSTLQ